MTAPKRETPRPDAEGSRCGSSADDLAANVVDSDPGVNQSRRIDQPKVQIRDDFRDLIPPPTEAELAQLHQSLDGSLGPCDALVVWLDPVNRDSNVLLDGHHRYAHCKAKGYSYEIRQVIIQSEEAARNWIILNQLGRRNLSPEAADLLRGKLYLGRKKNQSDNLKSDAGPGRGKKKPKDQNDPSVSTAEQVAKETGVSPAKVKRDAKFAQSVKKLGIEKEVISGKEKRSKKEIIAAANPKPASGKAKKPAKAKDKLPPPGPPCNGMQFARMAIMDLEEIRPDDTEREEAFAKVHSWLAERGGCPGLQDHSKPNVVDVVDAFRKLTPIEQEKIGETILAIVEGGPQ